MSYITQAEKGLKASEAGDHDEAIKNLSAALSQSLNPTWLLARSRNLISKSRYAEALADAEAAFHAAYTRNSRPMMQEAQYRRAVAHNRLEQPANAAACSVFAICLAKGGPAVIKREVDNVLKDLVDANGFWKQMVEEAKTELHQDPWSKQSVNDAIAVAGKGSGQTTSSKRGWDMAWMLRMQAITKLGNLPENDEKRKVTVSQRPEQKEMANIKFEESSPAKEDNAGTAKPVVDTIPRIDDYQTATHINASIFSKGNSMDDLSVEFGSAHVSLDPLVHPDGSKKALKLDLWDEIEPEVSKYSVTPNKVELVLKKKNLGKWAQLRGQAGSEDDGAAKVAKPQVITAAAAAETPSEKVAAQSKGNTSTSGLSKWYNQSVDMDGLDEEDEESVNAFFKKLYKNASPEQQRAMIKSFTESSGTSLSTDWKDVGSRHVAPAPPEGAEAKSWDK